MLRVSFLFKVLVLVAALTYLVHILAAGGTDPNTEEHFMMAGGMQRRYLLHLPPDFDRKHPAPLILMLHGGGGTPEHAADFGIAEVGDPKGFVVAYPEGLGRSWNDGRAIAVRNGHNDVAFLSALIDELVRTHNINPKRVYTTGMSNGGFMSFTLACRLADKITAIAPVAGSMAEGSLPECKPSRPVPVLMINGTADPLVHYDGGPVATDHGRSEPIAKVVKFWRDQNCGAAKPPLHHEDLPYKNPNDSSTVTEEWIPCPGGEVVNYTVVGGGHTWPGLAQYLFRQRIARGNREFDASEVIVDFFARH